MRSDYCYMYDIARTTRANTGTRKLKGRAQDEGGLGVNGRGY